MSRLRDSLRRVPGFPATNRVVRVTSSALRSRFLSAYPPGGFYSPVPAEGDIPADVPKNAKEIPAIELREGEQLELLQRIACENPFPDEPQEGFRFHLDNEYYSYCDASVLHAMLRHYRPRRVVEVGSGFSSAVMLDTRDRFLDRGTELTFIDPHPERLQSLLRDDDAATVLAQKVQDVDLAVFEQLRENDFCFVDSSHVVKLGSDVAWIVFEILPRLASGVVIHFHDVPWPFEYPMHWLRAGRAWNEAYFLRSFLQYNDRFPILFFNDFMATHHAQAMRAHLPVSMKKSRYPLTLPASSLWLVKR
jgi:predicted O-methyltransferase YrrM